MFDYKQTSAKKIRIAGQDNESQDLAKVNTTSDFAGSIRELFTRVRPKEKDRVDKDKIYEGLNKCYFSEQCHEEEVIDHLPEILEGVKVFVDVGASLGQYTFHANKYMRGGEILAIEADPIRFEELERNCRKWQPLSSNKLRTLFAAVSDNDEKTTFYITNSSKSGGLFKRDIGSESVNWCQTVVDSVTLDSLFKDRSPDLVKIDVEGAESRVLKGALRILREGKTKFLVEVHAGVDPKGQKNPDEVFKFMESFGYASTNFHGRSLFVNKAGDRAGNTMVESGTLNKSLKEFADKYKGKRAFIIGNGPSLKKVDLTKLKDEITFGVNSIFYHFDEMGFKPTFYVVEDILVAEDRAEEINALTGMVKIFGEYLKEHGLQDKEDVIWANVIYDFSDYSGFPHFSRNAAECLWVGGTVSYLCMQLAYYMGFDEVYLIGFDHSYLIPKDAKVEGTVITSASDDPNHFHPDYFGKGKRWHDPRLDRMEKAYERAREVFQSSGRKIFNATPGSKLEIFPRRNYESLFNTATDDERYPFNFRYIHPEQQTAQTKNCEPTSKKTPKIPPKSPRFSHLVLDYTRLCNSRCTYCGIWKMKGEPELGLDAIERTFSSLRAFGLGCCYVTGGEPYISDKIVDIACLLHKYLPKCRISGATNGVQPKQILERVQNILSMGVSLEVHVSINGCEATHDATRGGPGFWKKAVCLLDTLKSSGVPVVASMSLMPQTIADLPYMQQFCAEKDIRLMFSWVRQSPRYGTVDEYYSIWPEELKPKLRQIEHLPDEFDCPGLSKRLVIVPDGSVYPCEVYHPEILLGNVNKESLGSMLNSPRAASIAQMISAKSCYWCQGQGESDGSPKWMLMDCYRRHSKQFDYLVQHFPQAVNMPPQESKQVIESILSHKSFHQIPAPAEQESIQMIKDDDNESGVRISVIVCTYRNPDLLVKALESLMQQTLDRQLYEVIVVDNNSQDNTRDVATGYPSVRYVFEEELGLSHARNVGIRAARGDIIAFIDDDAEASPGWAQALLKVYDSAPDAWAIGGKVLPIWDAEKPEWLTEEYYRFLSLVEWGEYTRVLCWPDRIIGTNCSFRRQVFTDTGYFDTSLGRIGRFTLSFEDIEIQQRIHQIAHLVYYSPEAIVYHHVPAFRMTKQYFCKRTLGNTISEMLMTLCEAGKRHEIQQFVDGLRDMAAELTDESGNEVEEQILENAYSMFMQGYPDIPVEARAKLAYMTGKYYSQQEKYEQAEKKCMEGLSLPNISEEQTCRLLVRLGHIYLGQERYDEAEQKFNETLSLGEIDGETRFYALKGLGACYGEQGRCAEMAKKFDEILALRDIPEKNKIDAMRCFGTYYFKHETYKEAEQLYLRMLGKADGKGKYHVLKGLGVCYGAQGRYIEMGKKVDEILTSGDIPEDCKVDAVLSFGRYYLVHGKHNEAEQLYLRVLEGTRGKERYRVLKGLGICYGAQGRFAEMERKFDEISASADISEENKVDATVSFGRYYLFYGRYKEAEQLYSRAFLLGNLENTNRYHLVLGLGDVYFEQRKYSEAKEKFDEALLIEDIEQEEKFWALMGLVRYELVQDRFAEAQARYQELFFNDDYSVQQKVVLAGNFVNYHAAKRHYEEVVEIYKQVCSLDGLAEEDKSLFVGIVKDAISRIKNNDEQKSVRMIKDDDESGVRISVIVCTYRNPDLLVKTLDSLNRQTLVPRQFEVIVVDNNSQDNTKDVVSCYPSVRYVFEEKLGLSHARNTGVHAAHGDIIAFIDDDAEVSPGWVQALLKAYESFPDAWAVGGKVLPIWDVEKPEWLTEKYYRSLSLVEWGETSRPLRWPERIIGTNCSFRREVFTNIGYFDTGLGRIGPAMLGNEDTEIQERIHALGHLVYYTPEAVVHHHVPASHVTKEYFQCRSEGTRVSEAIMNLRSQGRSQEAQEITAGIRRKIKSLNFAQKQQRVLETSNTFLEQYKDKHRGQRCVIIGNGPSLNKMDLSFLKNEITFGLNRIYLLFDKWDFAPTYYVSVNPLVVEQSVEEILNIPSTKFLGLSGLQYIPDHSGLIFLRSIHGPFFAKDPRNGLWEGHTVTYVAMQLAYFMGFSEVILIGVDHNFVTPEVPNQEVVSEGNDVNHFHPDYFGKGTRWNLPDLRNSEIAYRLAKQAFETDGRRIIDATIDGCLNIFPKTDYQRIFFPASYPLKSCESGPAARFIDTDADGKEYVVSAIVSTYNSERFIRGCLEDLENQTIADKLEIIVVNSGSQQNEDAIIRKFVQKYNNIIYIKTEQRENVYEAWNRAVRVARGKFLTNANTDDRHRRDALEIMANALVANADVALVYGDQIRTDTPNDTFANNHGTELQRRPDYSRERLLFGCRTGSQPMWRKSLHDELGYFDESLDCAADWDFWIQISSKYKFLHIPEFLGLYYHNEDGIEHSRKIHSLYERYIVGKRYGTPYISVIPMYESRNNPLVSVVMPAYNAATDIAKAIESVLIQNYRNFELVVVDDGSTDNTKDIVASFKDDKIKYFYKENAGAASARNLAIKKAKGQFIINLDTDDMMKPNFIAKHLQEFEKHPDVDLVYCDDYLIDEDDKLIRVIQRQEYTDRKSLIRDLFLCPILSFRTCIRRTVYDKIGFYDEQLVVGEDYDMMRRFVKKGLKMQHLKDDLYVRRIGATSLSRNRTAQTAKSHFEVVRRFADTFRYDELFPDVAWDKIAPEARQLQTKCLTAVNYFAQAQVYTRTNSPIYAKMAFEHAYSGLNDCLKIAPDNQVVKQLFQQFDRARDKAEAVAVDRLPTDLKGPKDDEVRLGARFAARM